MNTTHFLLLLAAVAAPLRADDQTALSIDEDAVFVADDAVVMPVFASFADDADVEVDALCDGDESACDCCCAPCQLVPNMIGGGNTLRMPIAFANGTRIYRHFTRIAENNSPLPRDRVSLSWKVMNGVVADSSPQVERDFDELNLRLEKTLFGGCASAEFILPWQSSSVRESTTFGEPGEETALGDVAFGLKALLHQSACSAVSAGLLVEAPTSQNLLYTGFRISQESWFFSPYVAAMVQPTERCFVQSFASYRMPSDWDRIDPDLGIREPNTLMLDASIGYWLIDDPGGCWLTGLAPMVEVHYSSTTEDYKPEALLTNRFYGRTDNLELTAGLTAVLCNRSTISAGFVVPLRENNNARSNVVGPTDRMFDWAFTAQVNVYSR